MNTRIHIAVCEANQAHTSEILQALDKILFSGYEYKVNAFTGVTQLLQSLAEDINLYDLIFTEIDFPKGNGMAMAKYLRKNHCKSGIVFLTNNTDMILEGYHVRAFDYLIKPVSLSRLGETMERFADENYSPEQTYCYKIGKSVYSINLDSIYYFTSLGRKIRIAGKGGQDSYYGKIDDIESILPYDRFVRPHQSYIVGLKYVHDYSRDCITMQDGTLIPISRQRLDLTRKKLNAYFLKKHM